MITDHRSLIEEIPSPEQIRSRLMGINREANLLRQLLRVSERRQQQMEYQQQEQRQIGGPTHAI
jgi:hypothetical protein